MKTCCLMSSFLLFSCSAFLEENPYYCDEQSDCEAGVTQCDLLHHGCVPLGSLGPPPTVTAITPAVARTTGGTPMTLSGSNFRPGMPVIVNGDTQHPITPTAVTSTSLQFTMPAVPGLCGAVAVTMLDELGQAGTGQAMLRMKYGRLQMQPVNSFNEASAVDVALGDLDGDSNTDMLIGYDADEPFLIYKGNGRLGLTIGRGRFGPLGANYGGMRIADVDRDNRPDILSRTKDTLTLFLGQGNLNFMPDPEVTQTNTDFAVADLDSDDLLDLVIATPTESSFLSYSAVSHYNGLAQVVGAVGAVPTEIVATTLDSDLNVDVAVASRDTNTVELFFGAGNGSFVAAKSLSVSAPPRLLRAVDFDGDNQKELIIATDDLQRGELILARIRGGEYVATFSVPIDASPLRLFATDFDCDGRDDVALFYLNEKYIRVYLNTGEGTFDTTPIDVDFGDAVSDLATGQLDHRVDMKPDFVTIRQTVQTSIVTVFRNISD